MKLKRWLDGRRWLFWCVIVFGRLVIHQFAVTELKVVRWRRLDSAVGWATGRGQATTGGGGGAVGREL